MLSEQERATILDAEVARYARVGFRVAVRTPTTAQMVRPKRFSLGWALLWLLVVLIGFVIYLLYYLSKRDELVYLAVDERGLLRAEGDALPDIIPTGGTAAAGRCWSCGKKNAAGRYACAHCGEALVKPTPTSQLGPPS